MNKEHILRREYTILTLTRINDAFMRINCQAQVKIPRPNHNSSILEVTKAKFVKKIISNIAFVEDSLCKNVDRYLGNWAIETFDDYFYFNFEKVALHTRVSYKLSGNCCLTNNKLTNSSISE